MAKQNKITYPKSIGAQLWLYFVLFIDARPFTGLVKTTLDELHANSSIPRLELKRVLRKLVTHGFITMRITKQNVLVIKLNHYGSSKAKFKPRRVAIQTRRTPEGNRTNSALR